MIIEHLLPLLPTEPDTRLIVASGAGVAIGMVLWLAGARFSRYIVTLVGVAVGAYAGRHVPYVFSWDVDPMGPVFGLALALGVLAFLAHWVIIAWLLGVVLSLLAMIVAWDWHGAPTFELPPVQGVWAPDLYLQDLWAAVPPEVRQVAPHAGLVCIIIGWGMALLWPRVGVVTLYSLLGLILSIFMGLCLIRMTRPSLFEWVPVQPAAQGTIALGLLVIGMLAQWMLLPKQKQQQQSAADPTAELAL